jgi:hypothetical protein
LINKWSASEEMNELTKTFPYRAFHWRIDIMIMYETR